MMPAYKDKKKGTWYVAFYYKDWTGSTKHTVRRGFKTKGEASQFEKEFLNTLLHSADITFGALVANYLEYLAPRIKPTTMSTKRYIIDDKILPYFDKMKICDIDTISIMKWQNTLMEYRDEKGKPYAPTFLKTINAQLSSIFNYAVKHYRLMQNPCYLAGSIGKQRAEEMEFWTKDEFNRFIETVDKPAFKLFFTTLFYTGMRCGEALALTANDILEDKKIVICKNFTIVDGEEVFLTPKTERSKRTITIPVFLYEDIKDYLNKLYGYKPTDRIFYFTKHAATREIHRYAKKQELRRYEFMTFVTLMPHYL